MSQQQFEKNPNGGYIKPNDFGGLAGKCAFTRKMILELLSLTDENDLNSLAPFYVNANQVIQGQYGPVSRVTMKHHVPHDASKNAGVPQPQNQSFVAPAPQAAPAPAAAPATPQPQDTIPF